MLPPEVVGILIIVPTVGVPPPIILLSLNVIKPVVTVLPVAVPLKAVVCIVPSGNLKLPSTPNRKVPLAPSFGAIRTVALGAPAIKISSGWEPMMPVFVSIRLKLIAFGTVSAPFLPKLTVSTVSWSMPNMLRSKPPVLLAMVSVPPGNVNVPSLPNVHCFGLPNIFEVKIISFAADTAIPEFTEPISGPCMNKLPPL